MRIHMYYILNTYIHMYYILNMYIHNYVLHTKYVHTYVLHTKYVHTYVLHTKYMCIRIYYILTRANVHKNAGASLVTDLSKLVDGPDEEQVLLGLKVIKLLEGTTRMRRTSKDRHERQCSRITCLTLQLGKYVHTYVPMCARAP